MRGLALGFVATGSLVGIALSPLVMAIAEWTSSRVGGDALGWPWLMLPLLIAAGMLLVTFVKPDPKEIGQNLDRYYPGYVPPPRPEGRAAEFSAKALLKRAPARLAIVSNAAAQGNMAIVMVLTSLVLAHHGHSLTMIAVSHMFHSAGMFAFTIPLGWAADRFGREWVMYPGVGITLIGALFVALGSGFVAVTIGTFLVGLGWSAANVASTAYLADQVDTAHRGRAIGVSETGAGAMALVAAAVTGPLIECASLSAAGIAAALVAVIPLVMLAMDYAAQRRAR
jgi:hypothetical protein